MMNELMNMPAGFSWFRMV